MGRSNIGLGQTNSTTPTEGESECGLVNEHGKRLAKPLVRGTNSAVIRQDSDKTNDNVTIDIAIFFWPHLIIVMAEDI